MRRRPTQPAGVAQLVEQLIRNQQVVGSSPTAGSRIPKEHRPRGFARRVADPLRTHGRRRRADRRSVARAVPPLRLAARQRTAAGLAADEGTQREVRVIPLSRAGNNDAVVQHKARGSGSSEAKSLDAAEHNSTLTNVMSEAARVLSQMCVESAV